MKRDVINLMLFIALMATVIVTIICSFSFVLDWGWFQYIWAFTIGIPVVFYLMKKKELAIGFIGLMLLVASLFYVSTLPIKVSWEFTLAKYIHYKTNPIYFTMFLIYLYVKRNGLPDNIKKLGQFIYSIIPGE
jgi:hypothetical protein